MNFCQNISACCCISCLCNQDVDEREKILKKQNLVRVLAQLLVNLKTVKENKQEAINILNSAPSWPVNSEIDTAFGLLLLTTKARSESASSRKRHLIQLMENIIGKTSRIPMSKSILSDQLRLENWNTEDELSKLYVTFKRRLIQNFKQRNVYKLEGIELQKDYYDSENKQTRLTVQDRNKQLKATLETLILHLYALKDKISPSREDETRQTLKMPHKKAAEMTVDKFCNELHMLKYPIVETQPMKHRVNYDTFYKEVLLKFNVSSLNRLNQALKDFLTNDYDLVYKNTEQLFGLSLLRKSVSEAAFGIDSFGLVLKKLRFKEVLIGSVIVEEMVLKKRLVNLENPNLSSFRKTYLVKSFKTEKKYLMKTIKKTEIIIKNQISKVDSKPFDTFNSFYSFCLNEKINNLAVNESPFFVKLLATVHNQYYMFYFMEPMSGLTLDILISKEGLPLEHIEFYASELMFALTFLKKKQIIHLNVNPTNCLIDFIGHCKLTGFEYSISTAYSQSSYNVFREMANQAEEFFYQTSLNNANYMRLYRAPEFFESTASYPVDWWSLGVVIYQCLTTDFPFGGPLNNSKRAFSYDLKSFLDTIDNLKTLNEDKIKFTYSQTFIKINEGKQQSMKSKLTNDLANLLKRFLTVDPEKRIWNCEIPWYNLPMGQWEKIQKGEKTPPNFDKVNIPKSVAFNDEINLKLSSCDLRSYAEWNSYSAKDEYDEIDNFKNFTFINKDYFEF